MYGAFMAMETPLLHKDLSTIIAGKHLGLVQVLRNFSQLAHVVRTVTCTWDENMTTLEYINISSMRQ